MRALEALLKDLATSTTRNLKELVRLLLHNVMAPEGGQAFTQDILHHVCEMVLEDPNIMSKEAMDDDSPRLVVSGSISQTLEMFMQELGHFAEPHGSKAAESDADDVRILVDRAVEVVALLSMRWFAMQHHIALPEMSDYMKQKWLPPAFSYLVGQILWRQRTAEALQCGHHTSTVENLQWIALSPGAKDDMIDQCNVVFRVLSGSDGGIMKLSQWRKVVELIAMNPELRLRVRRVDAIRACYGDAVGHAENGLSRKNFKLMLLKTADLIGVHPVVIFRELASHAEELEASQKTHKENARLPFS